MKKQSSLSTNHTLPRRNSEDPNENEKRSNNREEDTVAVSPIRWGFLTAGVAHLANVFGSGLTSAHPWVCLHGSVNLVLAGVLGYIVLCWNRRFNTDSYVRRELMRFSLASGVAMIGLMAGHTSLVIAYNSGASNQALCDGSTAHLTGYGCMSRMFIGTPVFYAVLGVLWFAFTYIQHIAVVNLESSRRSRLPHTTTIDQEVQNSMATGNHQRDLLMAHCRSGAPGSLFYALSIFSSLALWAMGLAHLKIQTVLSVAAILSATMILGGVVSLGTRSSWIALGAHAVLIVLAVSGLGLSFIDNDGTSSRGVRVTAAIATILLQLMGITGAWLRFRRERESDRSRHEHATEHFFRSNPRAPVAEQDPMAVFAAANKEAGSADPPSMV